ncbi:DUF4136 domain-containing protein [Vibrio vulnificus]|jgi:hypothetical protein|nr:DUF4136 domain-containing protein [Vibrio vulnificus]EHK2886945.1 DUF4136 domain-containing protein [Vibrio parahaemolyticus]EHH0682639.1 DUF4136 domain-containing protein [Vibrio vulnificus]EHU4865923.1 DUF4136 domain-containing protein [Vibrio vulnificus]EHV9588313.1 DUF4136 domain-containing protein [Vibrio vulnificus]
MLRFITILLATTLTACSSINTDIASQIDFEHYQTFEIVRQDKLVTTIDEQRIEKSLIEQLTKKNLSRVEVGGDLYVQYRLEEKVELVSSGSSVGFSYGINNFHSAIAVPQHYRESEYTNLVIELVDNDKNLVVWKANSDKKLTPAMDSNERDKLITSEIKKMFEQYPVKVTSAQTD